MHGKALALLTLAAGASAKAPAVLTDDYTFEQYAVDFKRSYSKREVSSRQKIFEINKAKILAHNKSGKTWTENVNEFTDALPSEVHATHFACAFFFLPRRLVLLSRNKSLPVPFLREFISMMFLRTLCSPRSRPSAASTAPFSTSSAQPGPPRRPRRLTSRPSRRARCIFFVSNLFIRLERFHNTPLPPSPPSPT